MEEQSKPLLSHAPPAEAAMGVLCGLAMWLGGWVLQHAFSVERSVVGDPMFWVLASAPFWFGGFGWLAGERRIELQNSMLQLRNAAEDSIRELNQREFIARTALHSTYDAVLFLNLDGFVVEANEAAGLLFGYPAENVPGMRIETLIPDHDRLDKTSVVQRRAPLGDRLVFEWQTRGRHADGTVFAADLQIVLLSEQSIQVFLIREASARVQREERLLDDASELQKNRWVLEQRRRGVVVQVLGDAMRSEVEQQIASVTALGTDAPELLVRTLDASADRLLERIDQLWNLAMWERTSASPTIGPIDLKALLTQVAEAASPVAHRQHNTLTTEVQAGAEEIVGDPHLLSCAMRNLVLHGLRRVRNGAVRVEVTREAGRGTDWVAMYVEDDGKGLTARELDEIHACFELSADLSPPPDPRSGIALSHRLARSLGGHVAVHPNDSGNVLCLRLPIEPSKVKTVPARQLPRMDSVSPAPRL